jgi:hypothetical protein
MQRLAATALVSLALSACGDDGGNATTDSTAGSTTTDATGTTDSTTTGTTTASSSDTTASSGGSSSGGVDGEFVLQNDGWEDPAAVAFQEGFVQDECWASVFVPDPAMHYPFVIDGVSMFVGGDDMGSAEFRIELWDVDDQNMPSTMVGQGTTMFSGENSGFDATRLEIIGIESPTYTEGNFVIAVCLLAHDGFPAIARDSDGDIMEDRNLIRLADGTWIQSSTAGLTGDWVMRATIVMQ